MKAENLKHPFLLSAIVKIFGEFFEFFFFFLGGYSGKLVIKEQRICDRILLFEIFLAQLWKLAPKMSVHNQQFLSKKN